MRRIVAFNRVTADGYFAAPDDNLSWVVPEVEIDRMAAGEIDKAAAQGNEGVGTILFGRRTYELFERFWPHALDDSPAVSNPHGGPESFEMSAMAIWINEATKLVFSRTLKAATWRNSRLLHELDPREIEALKAQPGKDMMVFGSGSIVSQLTGHGLIDEYQFVVTPLLLGGGRSLVNGMPQSLRLKLLEARAYPSGNVMLRYARA